MTDERRDADRTRLLEELAAVEALEGRELPEGDELLKLDPDWVALRRRFDEAFAAVGLGEAVPPPPALKARILSRLEGAAPPGPALLPGGRVVAPGIAAVIVADAPWVVSPLPGIEYKLLHRDEEVFVLDGTLTLNGILLKPGDYCRADAGTAEPTAHSDAGGMAIIVSSDLDAFDPSDAAPAG